MSELSRDNQELPERENPLLTFVPRGLRHFATGELLDKLQSFRVGDRLAAIDAIGAPRDGSVARALALAILLDKSSIVRNRAASALSQTSFPEAQMILADGAVSSESLDIKKSCLAALKSCDSPAIHQKLLLGLRSETSHDLLLAASTILRTSKDRIVRQSLVDIIRQGPAVGAVYACSCLAGTKDNIELDALIDAINKKTVWQQTLKTPDAAAAAKACSRSAAYAAQGLSSEIHVLRLLHGLDSPDEDVRAMSALALERCPVNGVGWAIIERLQKEESKRVLATLNMSLRSLPD